MHEDTFAHDFFICHLARPGNPAEFPRASDPEAIDSSVLSDDEWLDREMQEYHGWEASNQAIMQCVQRDICSYQTLQRDLSVSGLHDQALLHQKRRLSLLALVAVKFFTDPTSTMMHILCVHLGCMPMAAVLHSLHQL